MSFDAAFTDPRRWNDGIWEIPADLHQLEWLSWLLKAPRHLQRDGGQTHPPAARRRPVDCWIDSRTYDPWGNGRSLAHDIRRRA
jgi:hypothetical protein